MTATANKRWIDPFTGSDVQTDELRPRHTNDPNPHSFVDSRFAQNDLATKPKSLRGPLQRLLDSRDLEAMGVLERAGLKPEETERVVYVKVGSDSIEVRISLNLKTQKWEAEAEIDGDVKLMTDSDYDRLLGRLAVALNENAIRIRELSEQELLAVETLVQQNMLEAALIKALQWACGPKADLSDPRYTPAVNYAVLLVWNFSRHFAPQTQYWQEYLPTYVGDRRYTLPLLDSAYYEFKREQEKQTRASLFDSTALPPVPETPLDVQKGIEELPDDKLHELYHATLRDYSKRHRR